MKNGAIANGVACLVFSVLRVRAPHSFPVLAWSVAPTCCLIGYYSQVTQCNDAAEWEFADTVIRNTKVGGCLKRTVADRVLLQTCDKNDKVD
jgi:hypothetical protein